MDLLFSKYASPFVLLEHMLTFGRLSEYVFEVLNIENDRKLWELYLSCVANPYSEVTSFNDFKAKNTRQATEPDVDLEATVKQSFDVLQNFKPE